MQNHPLWRFSLDFYSRPGVSDACIRLQDRDGIDVNMLLMALWQASVGRHWPETEIAEQAAAAADWRSHCLLPLRAIRRYLKQQHDSEALHADALDLEIRAEQVQQARMFALCPQFEAVRCSVGEQAEVARANLERYLRSKGFPPAAGGELPGEAETLIEALAGTSSQSL